MTSPLADIQIRLKRLPQGEGLRAARNGNKS